MRVVGGRRARSRLAPPHRLERPLDRRPVPANDGRGQARLARPTLRPLRRHLAQRDRARALRGARHLSVVDRAPHPGELLAPPRRADARHRLLLVAARRLADAPREPGLVRGARPRVRRPLSTLPARRLGRRVRDGVLRVRPGPRLPRGLGRQPQRADVDALRRPVARRARPLALAEAPMVRRPRLGGLRSRPAFGRSRDRDRGLHDRLRALLRGERGPQRPRTGALAGSVRAHRRRLACRLPRAGTRRPGLGRQCRPAHPARSVLSALCADRAAPARERRRGRAAGAPLRAPAVDRRGDRRFRRGAGPARIHRAPVAALRSIDALLRRRGAPQRLPVRGDVPFGPVRLLGGDRRHGTGRAARRRRLRGADPRAAPSGTWSAAPASSFGESPRPPSSPCAPPPPA